MSTDDGSEGPFLKSPLLASTQATDIRPAPSSSSSSSSPASPPLLACSGIRSRSLPLERHNAHDPHLGNRTISLDSYHRGPLGCTEEEYAARVPFLNSNIAGKGGLHFAPVAMRGAVEEQAAEVISTLRGASYKLLRFHLHDWLAIIALVVLDVTLNIIHPFKRFVGATMIDDFMYPLKPNTIPFEVVPVIAIVIPLVFFLGYFLYSKDITDLHHATLGLFFAVLITAVITDAVKDAVGRPRPDFFWRCFPDGHAVFDATYGNVLCTGKRAVIKEGHKSFPSGHTSWSFAGLVFLSMYLAGKLQLFNQRGHVAKVAVVFTPILGALLVGLSRVDDYWHHWQDVFAGALLGSVMAVLCYHQFFPAIYDANSMGPYSYLQIGNNFKISWLSWFSRKRPATTTTTEAWPPQDTVEDPDVEDRGREAAAVNESRHGS